MPDRIICGDTAARSAAKLIAATFPGRSENDVCQRAAQSLGVGENTIRRILRRETKSASWALMLRCISICAAQGKDPAEIIGRAVLGEMAAPPPPAAPR